MRRRRTRDGPPPPLTLTPAPDPGPGVSEPGPFRAPTHPAIPRPRLYDWAKDPGYIYSDLPWWRAENPCYELPAWPDCPSCDGRGWYAEIDTGIGDLIDVRCPCYETEFILRGPPE